MTIGSCAIDLYRRKFLTQNIHKEYCIDNQFTDGETVKQFIFRGYRGGRTETFRRGDTDYRIKKDIKNHKKIRPYYYYDFNSMYMECMKGKFPLPSSARMRENRNGYLPIENIIKYDGVSECEVIVPYMKYPLLATTINKKLCFPIGKFTDVFTHGELQIHLKNGGKITKIFKTVFYTKTFKPFNKWVNTIYGHRLKAQKLNNSVYDTVYKNIGVNLYGKFGTHKLSKFEMINIQTEENLLGVQINDDNLEFSYRETPIECSQCYIFPIFASTVTMKGRIKLWKELVRLEAIQCDTDSIFTDKYVKPSDKLGKLKIEDTIVKLCPIKPKWYKYYSKTKSKWVYKLKGGQLGRNKDKTIEEEFRETVEGKPLEQWKFLKMKESIRGGGEPNERINYTKTFNTDDNKRIWIPNKFDGNMYQESEPIILGFNNIDELNLFFS
jgi:hypothetical protein